MAVQEIESNDVQGKNLLSRGIDVGALGLVMDIAQANQYTKPIPSCVRELCSNAIDSQNEKEKAISILEGKAKPEDYFVERKGELYKDSKWDPNYYNLEYLDKINNTITLIYEENEGTGRCDNFIVRDHGVGLGQSRLFGVCQVGYSTKRCRKDVLGSYGLGSKAGLATNAEFYKTTSVYNGVKVMLKIFNKKVLSLVPEFNIETSEPNIKVPFGDDFIYGIPTNEKNYTEISVPCYKHNKSDFINAVKTQLMYIKKVNFYIKNEYGTKEFEFKPTILYNSEKIIISTNSPFSKPHVIITKGEGEEQIGINYGFIDFKELEMEDLYGSIGIKAPIRQVYEDNDGNEVLINDGIDVVPSRESIRWTESTKAFIKQKFIEARQEALNILNEELKNENDFVKWLVKVNQISSGRNSNSSLSVLSNIVKLNELTPCFKNTGLEYGNELDFFFKYHRLSYDNSTKRVTANFQTDRSINKFNSDKNIFKLDANFSPVKNKYIFNNTVNYFVFSLNKDLHLHDSVRKAKSDLESKFAIERLEKKQKLILDLILSSDTITIYDDLEIPEKYLKALEDEEKQIEENEAVKELTKQQLRSLNQETLYNNLVFRYIPYGSDETKLFKNNPVSIKIENIPDNNDIKYVSTFEDESICHYYETLTNKFSPFEKVDIMLVSKTSFKHFKHLNKVKDLFGKVENKTMSIHNSLINWNTARIIRDKIKDLGFLENYKTINSEVAEDYKKLKEFVNKYHFDVKQFSEKFGMKEHHDSFISFLDTYGKVQEIITSSSEDTVIETLKEASKSLGNEVENILVYDSELVDLANKVSCYGIQVSDLCTYIQVLFTTYNSLDTRLTFAITDYINFKQITY